MRLPLAALLVAWGGLTDRHWTVPLAAMLVLLALWTTGSAVLLALLPLHGRGPLAGVVQPGNTASKSLPFSAGPGGA